MNKINIKCYSKKIKHMLIALFVPVVGMMLLGCSGKIAEEIAESIYSDGSNESGSGSDEILIDGLIDKIENEDSMQGPDNPRDTIKVYSEDGNLIEPEISVVEVEEEYSEEVEEPSVYADDPKVVGNNSAQMHNTRYAYSMLNESEQNTYCEIYNILTSMQDKVVLSTCNTEEIDHVFKCVMVDYPEIFYVKGYSLGKYMIGNIIDKVAFSGTYSKTRDEVLTKRIEVDNYVTRVIEKAPDGDDYSKIKYVYEFLINTNEYDLKAPDNQNILSVIDNGRTVCQGYAKMTQLLLNRMGIFCTLVNGESIGSKGTNKFSTGEDGWQSHVWNIVKCEGQYYILDTTWGDAAFTLVDSTTGESPVISINYEYCLVNDDALTETHKANPVVEMPKCSSLENNYYVREGLYFTEVNDNKVKAAFDKAYANGKDIVCFKAADANVLRELVEYLIDEQNIFELISRDNVKYVEYTERNMLLFTI